MFRHHKRSKKVFSTTQHGHYEESCYTCKECNISCTSAQQLEQHLIGIKHQERVKTCQQKNKELDTNLKECSVNSSVITSAEDSMFPIEHMFILDETDEDTTNECAASCGSSVSEAAISSAGFETVIISKKHMVVLDVTYDDEHPAYPASCDSSSSEVAPSSPGNVEFIDEQPKKRARMEIANPYQNAPSSPLSDISISSSNSAPEAENVNEESENLFGQELHRTKDCKKKVYTKQKNWQENVLKPVTCNQDVFHFLRNFQVTSKSDVTFASRIARMFSKSLNKYREDKLEEMLCTEEEEGHHVSHNASLSCSPSTHGIYKSETGLWVDGDYCLTAEAACSDDDDA